MQYDSGAVSAKGRGKILGDRLPTALVSGWGRGSVTEKGIWEPCVAVKSNAKCKEVRALTDKKGRN